MERPLDCLETCFKYFHDTGSAFLVAKVFFLSSEKPITYEKLEEAMTIIASTHPLLRMCIKDINGVPTWREMDEMKLDIRLDMSNDWNTVFAKVLKDTYDIEIGPLWSLTLMPNARSEYHDNSFKYHVTLVFGYLHAIANAGGILKLFCLHRHYCHEQLPCL